MRISLLRIWLVRFFKTFRIYLANVIIVFFILLLRFHVYFAYAIIVFFTAIIWLMRFYVRFILLLRSLAKNLPNAIFG